MGQGDERTTVATCCNQRCHGANTGVLGNDLLLYRGLGKGCCRICSPDVALGRLNLGALMGRWRLFWALLGKD